MYLMIRNILTIFMLIHYINYCLLDKIYILLGNNIIVTLKYFNLCVFLGPPMKLKVKANFPKFMECPNGCGYTYTMVDNFTEHINKFCNKNKYYMCLYCNTSFHLNEQLKKHLIMIHKCF